MDRHRAALSAWRDLSHEEQVDRLNENLGTFRPSTSPDGGRLRVGLWSPVLFEAGAEAWMLSLARALAPVVSWRGLTVSEGRAAATDRMAQRFRPLMPVGFGREACKALAAECDVVVSWAMNDVPSLLDRLPCRPKVVSVCHAPVDSEWGMNSYRDPSGIDAYVAVSELALGPICEPRRAGARVIWNAVDESRLVIRRDRATMRRTWGVPDGSRVAGYLGRLAHEKRPLAMARLVAHLPDPWHAVVVGEGHCRARVEALAAGLGVTDRLHLVGPDHAAGDVLGAFDTLIVPSEYESFGLTLAEGLWAGVPVVATRVGLAKLVPGLVREVADGDDGREMARAVLADEADPAGTRLRVVGASEFARENLRLARFAREWADFLSSLAEPRAARLARVQSCPDRGPVLPISMQDDCGCRGKELSECRAGKGSVPGRVTLRDCMECRSVAL